MSEVDYDPLSSKREKLLVRLIPYIQKQGISQMKMEDAAKCMDISKATLYKYFDSKDEIVGRLLEQYVQFLSNLILLEAPQNLSSERISQPSEEELKVYNESFAKVFRMMIKQTFFLTDILLQDLLNGSYPQLSVKLTQALDQFQKKLVAYFDSGIEFGMFYPIANTQIYLVQMDLMIRKLMDPKWLMMQNMTLKQALMGFYKAMKHQIFYEKWICENDSDIEAFLDKLIMDKLIMEKLS
ncbi:TetR/AcrR family transcriptional regulator [Paenibacillus sp. 19GGS1-52]|uniref:TetR/AcrR family transcriptional regulator n=1 Tax=Paenibacillus sp. 19GGS1-52 TaxID=2758563 RepID=UPI001EFB1D35|nr:TetR/AcrR family transcriptional regulator [Paenibacillus sp. 19GGS1-52]ULO06225.1 TetR/AcrR family transcriptional regulator [Paenibacillus sp. 19GGS1-52]